MTHPAPAATASSRSAAASSAEGRVDAGREGQLDDTTRRALLADLASAVAPDRLLVAADELFVYECDAQTFDRGTPFCLVLPESTDEVRRVLRACAVRGVPFVARGAGTGLSGGAVARGSVVVCTSRMDQIHEVDVANRTAWVGPGVVNARLSKVIRAHGLHYAPDPSSQNACTIGGNVAENSGGPHTLKYGVTGNHVLALEVVLADGEVAHLGSAAADAPGYDWVSVFVGSEGTFGIATKILVRLTPLPEGVETVLAIFNSVGDACQAVTAILRSGVTPAALEMIDQTTLRAVEAYIHAGFPENAAAVLLVEVDGLVDDLGLQAERVTTACRLSRARELRRAHNDAERQKLWKGRKQAFGALGRLAPNAYVLDGVIPRTKLPEVLALIDRIAESHGVRIANVFHAGDGNLHPTILYDERSPGALERVRAASDDILDAVIAAGGTLSGEHGIGLEKIGHMGSLFNEADLSRMREVREVFDPRGLCNPGKAIPAPGACVEVGPARKKLPVGH